MDVGADDGGPPGTFAGVWDAAVRDHGGRTFLVTEEGPAHTYREFDDLVAATAAGLRECGTGPGDVVHLVLPNSVAFVAVWFACARLGATFSSADPRSTAPELTALHARLRPRVAVVGPEQAAAYPAGDGTPVVVAAPGDASLGGLAGGAAVGPGTAGPSDRLAILFTSGTTSAPKGVELTQATYAATGRIMAAAAGLSAEHRWLVVLPLFHANAQYYCLASAVAVGASVALMPAFSATRYLDQADRYGVTHGSLFAAPVRMILARGRSRPLERPLEHMWFAQNLTPAEYDAFAALVGCRPRQLYGMTETGPAVLASPVGAPRPDSMGRPVPGCAVRLVRLDGDGPSAPGEVGGLQVGGVPGRTLFSGYLDDPVATAASVAERGPDGWVWFATGDRASADAAGDHVFAGRGGDQLKVAGENVSVVEVEQAVAAVEGVFEVAVVARPDPVRTEVPVAFVVATPDRAGAPGALVEAVRAHCAAVLAPAKRPHEIHVVDELPRTSVGKIRKFLLHEAAADGGRDSREDAR